VGVIDLPEGGLVYLDTSAIIYSVEKIEPFYSLLTPLWDAAKAGQFGVITSELTLLETLVKPLQARDLLLQGIYRSLLTASRKMQLVPISRKVIEAAANIRAEYRLKTPDAIHVGSADGCSLFVTNDPAFQRVAGLPVTVLNDLLTA